MNSYFWYFRTSNIGTQVSFFFYIYHTLYNFDSEYIFVNMNGWNKVWNLIETICSTSISMIKNEQLIDIKQNFHITLVWLRDSIRVIYSTGTNHNKFIISYQFIFYHSLIFLFVFFSILSRFSSDCESDNKSNSLYVELKKYMIFTCISYISRINSQSFFNIKHPWLHDGCQILSKLLSTRL